MFGKNVFSDTDYFIAAVFLGVSHYLSLILVGRFVSGFSIGLLSSAVPVYICEVVESRLRGALGSFPQLMVSVGVAFQCFLGAGELLRNPSEIMMHSTVRTTGKIEKALLE